jgi:hypothetical protein
MFDEEYKNEKTSPANEDCIRSVTISTTYSPRNLRSLKVCTSYYLCKLNSVRVCTYYARKLDFAKVCTSYYPRNLALHSASQFTLHFQGRFDHNYAINLYFIFLILSIFIYQVPPNRYGNTTFTCGRFTENVILQCHTADRNHHLRSYF